MANDNKKEGRAYSFFDCRYPKEQIEALLPQIREMVETPSELELSLVEHPEKIDGNRELKIALETAKRIDLNKIPEDEREGVNVSYDYVIKARYPHKTNDETATKLVSIMNGAYMSTPLWEYGEDFFGRTIYKQGDSYIAAERGTN